MAVSHNNEPFDLAIVGAGVLGVSVAYWLGQLYECSVALVDRAPGIAFHTSSRNTGVIHRPFYLDPDSKKVFAVSAELSYPMWRELARRFSLPWRDVGTLEVALREEDLETLQKYKAWGERNGTPENELEVLDRMSVKALEPEVECSGAIHSKTDATVEFGAFSKAVFAMTQNRNLTFLGGTEVKSVGTAKDGSNELHCNRGGVEEVIRCKFLINAAGGGAMDIAHFMEVGKDLTDLHFRGDYWLVDEPFASRVSRNIYSVARYPQFPFLDPHFVVRADGTRQIGPNAALVDGPFTYEGLGNHIIQKLAERPLTPKLELFTNSTFLSLIWTEWRSSVSKAAMCSRVEKFLPNLNPSLLNTRGLSGVRSSVIDRNGFVSEALRLETPSSLHVLNFNSPGATGAPVFSALVVHGLAETGKLGQLRPKPRDTDSMWKFDDLIAQADAMGALSSAA